MLADHRFVRSAAARIAEAADAICSGLGEGLVRSAAAFTDRLVRQAAKRIDRFQDNELRWGADAFVDGGSEPGPVADLLGTLEVDLADYSVRKGFLARALLVAPDHTPERADLEPLRTSCLAMLEVTPAAYVLIYRASGVIVVPASAVAGSVVRPDRLHRRQIGRFYEEHFSCFIGDHRLVGARGTALEDLARAIGARSGLALHVEHASTPRQESLFRR
jgi:hypothetical protein